MGGTVEVLPDVSGIDRSFYYSSDGPLPPGTIVRVPLHGRRTRGWVVGSGSAPSGLQLQPVLEVVSLGPPGDVVEICRWAAWRFCGPLRPMLKAASPERIVREPAPRAAPLPQRRSAGGPLAAAVREAVAAGGGIVRLPPAHERLPAVEEALSLVPPGSGALVLVETRDDAVRLAALLRRRGWPVALYPEEWAAGSTGRVVVGTRNAAFAPGPFRLLLVLDAHSDWYRSERTPNVDARFVVSERARRAGAPAVFLTPCPTVELAAEAGPLVTLPSPHERLGWGSIAVLDLREEDPAEGGYPSSLVGRIRQAASGSPRPVVCILNRTGRARLLACPSCRETQRCEVCGAAVIQERAAPEGALATLACPRCHATRRALCAACGSGRLRLIRPGVSRAREQLQAVTGLEVGELSGRGEVPSTPVIMATQAALSRLRSASLVVWLDFDQELLAPRLRAAEEALAFLARSVRLVGRRGGGGSVVVRTSVPGHAVVRAAVTGDPGVLFEEEARKREELRLPPYSALARLSGEAVSGLAGRLDGLEPSPGRAEEIVVRASSHAELSDALGALAEQEGGFAAWGVRVEVDPPSL